MFVRKSQSGGSAGECAFLRTWVFIVPCIVFLSNADEHHAQRNHARLQHRVMRKEHQRPDGSLEVSADAMGDDVDLDKVDGEQDLERDVELQGPEADSEYASHNIPFAQKEKEVELRIKAAVVGSGPDLLESPKVQGDALAANGGAAVPTLGPAKWQELSVDDGAAVTQQENPNGDADPAVDKEEQAKQATSDAGRDVSDKAPPEAPAAHSETGSHAAAGSKATATTQAPQRPDFVVSSADPTFHSHAGSEAAGNHVLPSVQTNTGSGAVAGSKTVVTTQAPPKPDFVVSSKEPVGGYDAAEEVAHQESARAAAHVASQRDAPPLSAPLEGGSADDRVISDNVGHQVLPSEDLQDQVISRQEAASQTPAPTLPSPQYSTAVTPSPPVASSPASGPVAPHPGSPAPSTSHSPTPVAVRSASPSPTATVDTVQSLALTDPMMVETARFAELMMQEERAKLCPWLAGQPVVLAVINASVQVTADQIVTMAVRTSDGQITRGVQVEWIPYEYVPGKAAYDRLKAELTATADVAAGNLVNSGAKLIVPKPACDFFPNHAQPVVNESSTNVKTETNAEGVQQFDQRARQELEQIESHGQISSGTLKQLEQEEDAHADASFDEEYVDRTVPRSFGVIVDQERESYARGLTQQKVRKLSKAQRKNVARTYPATHTWKTEKPDCLDYVHNQEDCGSCFMFAALDSLSDRHCINLPNDSGVQLSSLGAANHLSIQQALLCEPLGRQCAGGWADVAFNYSKYFGLTTEAAWAYDRSCLSDTVCAFGSQCFSFASHGCGDFFTTAQADKIRNFQDALTVVTDEKCTTTLVTDVPACKVWADSEFGFAPTLIFLPAMACSTFSKSSSCPKYCEWEGSACKEFATPQSFCERAKIGYATFSKVSHSSYTSPGTSGSSTSNERVAVRSTGGSSATPAPTQKVWSGINWHNQQTHFDVAHGTWSSTGGDGSVQRSFNLTHVNYTHQLAAASSPTVLESSVDMQADLPESQLCRGLFTPDDLARIRSFGDARTEARTKCNAASKREACKAWVDFALAGRADTSFRPTGLFCKKLREEFSRFDWRESALERSGGSQDWSVSSDVDEESLLEEGELEEAHFDASLTAGGKRWWGWWGRRRRSEDKAIDEAANSTEETNTAEASQGTIATVAADNCDKDRCLAEARPHSLASYHYITNTKEDFKKELYLEGPFYTSFYIYEDFTWFFESWTTLAYNHQWGASLGGHAVVLIGWVDGCEYHDGSSLLQNDADGLLEGARSKSRVKDENGRYKLKKQRHGSWADTTRRRSATGMCWHLRNTWGNGWADGGYFRVRDEMLTGPEGTHLHIASAAGDGATST